MGLLWFCIVNDFGFLLFKKNNKISLLEKMKFQFNNKYFVYFLLLFSIEVIIVLFIHDDFIRPFFGDYLVVFLVYCFVMSFVDFNKFKIASGCLLFAFTIELLQYLNFISIIGIQKYKLVSTIIGTSFAVEDLVAYFFGFLTILVLERIFDKKIT